MTRRKEQDVIFVTVTVQHHKQLDFLHFLAIFHDFITHLIYLMTIQPNNTMAKLVSLI